MTTITEDGYTEFRFFRPEVASVYLTGDFNDWRTDQLSMARQDDGYWVLRMVLPAGDHKFRYVADGMWYTDFASFGVEPGRFGMNSLLRIPAPTLKVRHAADQPARVSAARAA